MTEYVVNFQRGFRVGTRSLRTVHVEALTAKEAVELARQHFRNTYSDIKGYQLTTVRYFNERGKLIQA